MSEDASVRDVRRFRDILCPSRSKPIFLEKLKRGENDLFARIRLLLGALGCATLL
jgi:hypothetical protein